MSIPSATSDNWTNLKSLIRTLERTSISLGRIKESLQEFLELTTVYERFESSWDEHENLKQELETSFHQLNEGSTGLTRLEKTGCVEGLCRDIRVELAHIRHYSLTQQRNENRAGAEDSGELLAHYQRIQALLRALLLNMDPIARGDVGLETLHALTGDYKTTQAIVPDLHAHSAVRRLHSWMKDGPTGAVCWVPGTRRTGISHALCAELDATHRLGASLFFSPEGHDLCSIIPSIAYQLANYSTPFRLALLNSNFQASSGSPDVQFEELIASPLAKVRQALPTNLAVVIDVADECGDFRSILDAILAKSKDLPIKFIVFSRPEPNCDSLDGLFVCEVDRECIIEGAEGELRTALRPFGLSELQLVEFVQRAGVLFACAATATHCVGNDMFWPSPSVVFDSQLI